MYPTPPEAIGIGVLPVFRERYGCAVGLSDHSATIYPAIAAAMLGAEVIEVHVALSRDCFGPDVIASVTPAERSEEHTSELQSLMRISYAVFCLKKKNNTTQYSTKYTINIAV